MPIPFPEGGKNGPYTAKDKQKMYDEEKHYHPASRIFAVLNQKKDIIGTSRVVCSNVQDHYVLPITKEFDITKKYLYKRFQVNPSEADIYDVGRSTIDKEKLVEEKQARQLSMSMFEHLARQYALDIYHNDYNIVAGEPSKVFHRINSRIGFNLQPLGKPKEYYGIECIPSGSLSGTLRNNLIDNFSNIS